MRSQILLLVFCSIVGRALGDLRCYSCSFSSADSDRSCETISDATGTVSCSSTYCIILRQEFIDPPGEVASFLRGCQESPDFLNHEVTDSTFRTFYRACTSDLCNIGNGIQSVVGGMLSPTPDYSGNNLLVPGTSNAVVGVSKTRGGVFLLIATVAIIGIY